MPSKTFSANDDWDIGDADVGTVSRFLVQIEGSGWTGSVTPKGRAREASSLTYQAIGFHDLTAAPGSQGTTTAPTGDALLLVEASGMDIRLTVVASAGSVTIHFIPLAG